MSNIIPNQRFILHLWLADLMVNDHDAEHINDLLDYPHHDHRRHHQVLCSLCGWPMCSEECSLRSPHADLECQLFRFFSSDIGNWSIIIMIGFFQPNWLESEL